MTVVVWDGETLAADRAATDGAAQWETEKIWESVILGRRILISGAGPVQTILDMRNWYSAGARPNKFPNTQFQPTTWCHFVVVDSSGLKRWEQGLNPIVHGTNKCAFGEGKDFAYGAMEMGADAVRAVEIANKFSVHCGLGVSHFKIGGE